MADPKIDYQVYDLETSIGNYAKSIGSWVVYIRAYGWNNSDDVTKINASKDIYKNYLPVDLYNVLDVSEFNTMVIEDATPPDPMGGDIIDWCADTFPKSQADVEKEMYIYYAVFNELGQIIASND